MRKLAILTIGALSFSAPALANQCPKELATLDQHLSQHGSMLNADQTAQIRQLRAQAQEDHQAGRHDQAMQVIRQMHQIMGM